VRIHVLRYIGFSKADSIEDATEKRQALKTVKSQKAAPGLRRTKSAFATFQDCLQNNSDSIKLLLPIDTDQIYGRAVDSNTGRFQ